jgi:hypothetical protein
MNTDIVYQALANLTNTSGISGSIVVNEDHELLQLEIDGQLLEFVFVVKKELRSHQLTQIKSTSDQHPHFMLIAGHLFTTVKQELRDLNIGYLEANGNLFLKKDGLYLLIDHHKKVMIEKNKANRAFTKTGLRILFHLLNDKDLINKPQREIAVACGVALGNIPMVIEGLVETGYLIQNGYKKYVWENRTGLLERWINDYATVLRPKLIKGRYTLKKDWQQVELHSKLSLWGGEAAADQLTHYLRPEKLLIYTKEKQIDLIRNYHVIPQENGELEIHELFWKPEHSIAPPIIIYAELLLSGGKRNTETAQIIYDEYIKEIL